MITGMPIEPRKSVRDSQGFMPPPSGRQTLVRLDLGENTSLRQDLFPPGFPPITWSAYPDYSRLYRSVSALFGLDERQFHLTNGSDEALRLIASVFIEPGLDRAVISDPSFVVIPQSLELAGADLIRVPTRADLKFDLDGLQQAIDSSPPPKLVMLASPDNPSGQAIDPPVIESWLRQFPNTLFVIDEAYYEFHGKTVLDRVDHFDNLLVTRTFSKAWGLAGLRLGAVFGNESLISVLKRCSLPFSVNSMATEVCSRLINEKEAVNLEAKQTIARRNDLAEELRRRGYKTVPGEGNFLLFGAGLLAEDLCAFLRSSGVLVKNCGSHVASDHPLWGMIKVSIGSSSELNSLLAALDRYRETFCLAFDLDGTLIDTTLSYNHAINALVEAYTGGSIEDGELERLEQTGGYNDSWDKAQEIIRRKGVSVDRTEIVSRGQRIYFAIAKDRERLLIDHPLLDRLAHRFRLVIVSGRTKSEYELVWSEVLSAWFERAYLRDSVDGLKPKPAPDYLIRALQENGMSRGVYVGNTVDDMWAAQRAGLERIGVASVHNRGLLSEAGASYVIDEINDLATALQV